MGLFDPKPNVSTQAQAATTSSAPWAASVPLWNGILSGVGGIAGAGQRTTQDWRQAVGMTRQIANQGAPLSQDAYSLGQGILSPEYAMGGQTDPEFTNLMDMYGSKASARAASLMAGQGRGGGSEYGSAIARAYGEATAPLAYQNLQDRRNRQLSVMGMAPQLEEGRYAGADRLFALDQARVARPYANYSMALPFALGAGRMGGMSATDTSGTATTPGKSPIQGILGGAMAGSQFGWPGAVAGGVLGGLS